MKQLSVSSIVCFLSLILCLSAGSCSSRSSRTAEDKQPVITVTIEPQRYFAEVIAGDRFKVVSMVPKGTSPETYDPAPQQLVDLGESEAYLRIGHIGFEQVWMERLTSNAPHLRVFDTSEGIDLILDSHTHAHNGGMHHVHTGVEPHVWNSATNAVLIAGNIYKALSQLDKEHEPYYRARRDSLCRLIYHTDSIVRHELSAPGADRAFMIYHPALSYFARDYGLHQISIEEDGKEPSPAHLKALIDRCKEEQVHVIFVQPEFDKRNAETIARQTDTRIVPINPLSYDWAEEMVNVARALARRE